MSESACELRISLLGDHKICVGVSPITVSVRKAEAMLYYNVFSERPVTSLYLCDLLWPDVEEKKARQNLNDAVYNLKKGLQDAHAPETIVGALSRSRDGLVVFNKRCGYTCDVEEFEGVLNSATDKTDLQTLEKAFALYHGPFLDNFSIQDAPGFDAWVTAKRQRLHGAYCKLLHLLSTRYLMNGAWPRAIETLERLRGSLLEVAESQWDQKTMSDQEVVHGLLMMCHALTYRLDLAGSIYADYVQLQSIDSLQVSPSLTLEKLHKIIQTYQPSNLRVRTLIAEALRRISHRTMEPRLEDALLSVYAATGAQRAPRQGRKYRDVLLRAQKEALRHGAALIGTPHLLLALCDCTEHDFSIVQNCLPLSLSRLSQAIRNVLGEASVNNHEPTAYTLPLQHVLQVATDVAGAEQADTIDVSHLWIALVQEEHGFFSQLLEQGGIDRLEVLEQMEEDVR